MPFWRDCILTMPPMSAASRDTRMERRAASWWLRFSGPETSTVGEVLREIVSEEADFQRYRGQHPYIVDAKNRHVCVVSLRNLPTSNRSEKIAGDNGAARHSRRRPKPLRA